MRGALVLELQERTAYRIALGVTLVASLLLVWLSLGVGIIGRDGVFHYANAGHCPPLVISEGRLNELRATAIPVGLMEGVEFPSRHIVLRPGDKVVIYSDGVSEAQNRAGDFYGLDRLYAALTSTADACCSEVLDAIRKSVSEFTQGAEQGDDITVLVLGYAGEPPASSY